tara:strand:- start:1324 stop:1803 length:480 start_codon:yes stop_codon:yes gene_type:complete
MAYLLFNKDQENVTSTFQKLIANDTELANVQPKQEAYKVITCSDDDYNAVKYREKWPSHYTGDTVTFETIDLDYPDKEDPSVPAGYDQVTMQDQLDQSKSAISKWVGSHGSHPDFDKWNNYLTELNSLDISSWTYPTLKSLEKELNDRGQTSLSYWQLP